MIKYKIRDSDWLTFPLIIVNFNHLFIQRLQALGLLFLKGLRERNILNFIFQLNSTRVQFTNTLIFYNQNKKLSAITNASKQNKTKKNTNKEASMWRDGPHKASDFYTSLNSIPKERSFRMAFRNIVSLPAKIEEIRYSMSNKIIDLIAFNETRLDSNITNNMIHLNDYDLIRKDRSRNGGGVCICLRSSINYKIRNDLVPSELEAVCIEIIKPHSKPFFVTTVYRPPNALSKFFDYFEKLIKAIDNENKEMYTW